MFTDNQHRENLERLARLLPPPDAPEAPSGDWAVAEHDDHFSYPTDYKMFIARYGTGIIKGPQIELSNPLDRVAQVDSIFSHIETILRIRREQSPFLLKPVVGGLFPWAEIHNSEHRPDALTYFFWKITSEPEEPGIVVFDDQHFEAFDGQSMVSFLATLLARQIGISKTLIPDESVTTFIYEPIRELPPYPTVELLRVAEGAGFAKYIVNNELEITLPTDWKVRAGIEGGSEILYATWRAPNVGRASPPTIAMSIDRGTLIGEGPELVSRLTRFNDIGWTLLERGEFSVCEVPVHWCVADPASLKDRWFFAFADTHSTTYSTYFYSLHPSVNAPDDPANDCMGLVGRKIFPIYFDGTQFLEIAKSIRFLK